MQRQNMASGNPDTKRAGKGWLLITKYRRLFIIFSLVIALAGTGTAGYLLGRDKPVQVLAWDDTTGIAAFAGELADEEDRCAAIEQINVENELAQEKEKAAELSSSLEQQQNEIAQQQQEMDDLQESILKALMANLSDNLISRSGTSVAAYSQEAKNLISLSRKLTAFEKTPEASEFDLTEYKKAIDKRLLRLPTLKPIPGKLDGYGMRIHPIYKYRQFHPAADIGAATGTPIKAAGSGYVVKAGYDSSAGRYIKIDHGNGFTTTYMHCSKLYVSAGESVVKGDVIGAVGSTGTSTAPHLHFEIRYYDKPLNPNQMIME
ncbi:MAG: M23 family metallopeptidase [Clostridiaceae bacterium]|nr:M23 family metallopeptidase [Clostridiaceae bacterium]